MYNVIIVEDETWICKLIQKIVDWKALGFNIIADAGDGLTALSLIEKHKPNLVVTDIRMPGLDGISLIKAVREKKLDMEFIIISGYSDFEYARSALAYDAFAYILKPLDKGELEETLRRAKDKISQKRTIQDKLETSDTMMLESELRKILDKTNKNITAEYLNSQYKTKFSEAPYYAVIFKQDLITKDNNNNNFPYFLSKIKSEYADNFRELVYFPGKTKDQTIFIINLKKETDDIYSFMRNILQAFDGEGYSKDFTLTVSIGTRVNTIGDIDVSYESAANAMKARVFLGTGRVIDANKEAGRILDAKNIIDIRAKKKLSALMDVCDLENILADIKRILSEAEKKSSENLISCHLASYEILDVLFESMQKKGIRNKRGVSRQQAFDSIDGFRSVKEMEDHISLLIQECLEAYLDEKQGNGERLTKEIKRFISENYMSNISLDDVARLVCLSPTYVSEIFKRKTGENFSEYLIDYRIEIAKELLKDIRYRIVDVSLMVGYSDSKYFSRLFKKKVGVNPTDYRKFYL